MLLIILFRSNADLWQYLSTNDSIPEYMRGVLANRLAVNGESWCKTFEKVTQLKIINSYNNFSYSCYFHQEFQQLNIWYILARFLSWISAAVTHLVISNLPQFNSGTYNNQWTIVDYNLFTPGMETLNEGRAFLLIVYTCYLWRIRWISRTWLSSDYLCISCMNNTRYIVRVGTATRHHCVQRQNCGTEQTAVLAQLQYSLLSSDIQLERVSGIPTYCPRATNPFQFRITIILEKYHV